MIEVGRDEKQRGYDDDALNQALAAIGWRSTRSTIEGRRRVYDSSGLLVSVYSAEECWNELRARGLADRRGS